MPGGSHVATGREVVLRRKALADAEQDYSWRRDPELARLDGRDPYRSSYEDFLRSFKADLEFPTQGSLALAIDAAPHGHIGNFVAYDIGGGSCEIGLVIGPEERRGMGLGGDAICAFLRWAWASLGVRLVYLHTLEWNAPARRCFERCGFRAAATVERPPGRMIRYEAAREWWLLEDERSPYPRAGAERE